MCVSLRYDQFSSLGKIPRREIWGLPGISNFSSLRNFHTVLLLLLLYFVLDERALLVVETVSPYAVPPALVLAYVG